SPLPKLRRSRTVLPRRASTPNPRSGGYAPESHRGEPAETLGEAGSGRLGSTEDLTVPTRPLLVLPSPAHIPPPAGARGAARLARPSPKQQRRRGTAVPASQASIRTTRRAPHVTGGTHRNRSRPNHRVRDRRLGAKLLQGREQDTGTRVHHGRRCTL